VRRSSWSTARRPARCRHPNCFRDLTVRPMCAAFRAKARCQIDPAAVAPDPGAIERLEAICNEVSPALISAKILARQACYRPITRDGLPLIGRVPGVEGAYIATGHSVWGILNAPATGEAMAELITEGSAHTIDLSPFDPGRLPPLDPASVKYSI
jgi:glycine/D-amino acid oxidase-like deaminating enzyme